MPEFPTSVPQWYLPLTGALWAIVGLLAGTGLFRRLTWAPKFLKWASVCFVAWYWLDRLFFVRSEYGRSNWPASLIISVFALITIFSIQSRLDVRRYFQEKLNE
jgi:hypothetical protein